MLSVQKQQMQRTAVSSRSIEGSAALARAWRCRSSAVVSVASQLSRESGAQVLPSILPTSNRNLAPQDAQAGEIDSLYLFASYVEWEERENPSAGWELIAAAQSANSNVRAHARALLASSRHLSRPGAANPVEPASPVSQPEKTETEMNTPYDLEIIENCAECPSVSLTHFCRFSSPVLDALNEVTQKSTLPAGAILFVEGQAPRGIFIICSGRVNLTTTSRDGKMLILKSSGAGEALGLSATISGLGYEITAETATPCQLSFVDRKHYLELMELYGEVGMHTALCLSRDFRSAHRDIHDLILTRSSTGKLARLLLSQFPQGEAEDEATNRFVMTHEEIAHRIGASRETVTRLLGSLRKKRLISLDGPSLVIRDREGLKALTL